MFSDTHSQPRFELVAPSTITVHERFLVRLRVRKPPVKAQWAPTFFLDEPHRVEYGLPGSPASPFNSSPRGIHFLDNTDREWTGALHLDPDPARQGPVSVAVTSDNPVSRSASPVIGEFSYDRPGIYWLDGEDVETKDRFTSNPIVVKVGPMNQRLFWGDIHCHSFLTDGLRSPEEVHEFARDESCLDFFAFTEHAEGIGDLAWDYSQSVANAYNQPHSFATLVAFEWVSRYGHRNVYYRGNSGAILRSSDRRFDTLAKFWAALNPEEAIVVPHHSANARMGVDWKYGHHPELERLVEIYSVWGSSEMPETAGNPYPIRTLGGEAPGQHVSDALAHGYRMGFIGGGDIHDGRPGESLSFLQETPGFDLLYPQGLAGVWMPMLTRNHLWQALKAQRTYATTCARTYIECNESDGLVTVTAAASQPIARIVCVTDGHQQSIEMHSSSGGRLAEGRHELYSSTKGRPSYAYLRIETKDGQIAWTSPLFSELGE